MAEPEATQPEWFKEFKKVTAPSPPPAGSVEGAERGTQTRERRKHVRFEVDDAAARFHRRGITTMIGLSKLSLEGRVLDLSEGGLRLLTDERILTDTKIHIQIQIARFQDLIESDALTRWCHQHPKKENEFVVGVMFTGLDPSQARKFNIMREYFNSPQFKALREARIREQRTAFRFPK